MNQFFAILLLLIFCASCNSVFDAQDVIDCYGKTMPGLVIDEDETSLELQFIPELVMISNQVLQNNNSDQESLYGYKRDAISYVKLTCKGILCDTKIIKKLQLKQSTYILENIGVLPVQNLSEQNYFEYLILFGVGTEELASNNDGVVTILLGAQEYNLPISKEVVKLIQTINNELDDIS